MEEENSLKPKKIRKIAIILPLAIVVLAAACVAAYFYLWPKEKTPAGNAAVENGNIANSDLGIDVNGQLEKMQAEETRNAKVGCYLQKNPEGYNYFPAGEIREYWREQEDWLIDIQTRCQEFTDADYAEALSLLTTDADQDGLNAFLELMYGSDDTKKDSNNNGVDDLTEVKNHDNPGVELKTEYVDMSENQQTNCDQVVKIINVRYALANYYIDHGEFPETLATLSVNTTDSITNAPYPYKKEGNNYTLEYQMKETENNLCASNTGGDDPILGLTQTFQGFLNSSVYPDETWHAGKNTADRFSYTADVHKASNAHVNDKTKTDHDLLVDYAQAEIIEETKNLIYKYHDTLRTYNGVEGYYFPENLEALDWTLKKYPEKIDLNLAYESHQIFGFLGSCENLTRQTKCLYTVSQDRKSYTLKADFILDSAKVDRKWIVNGFPVEFTAGENTFSDQSNYSPWDIDTDGDGLSKLEERDNNTDANNPDTDGDGYSDGVEVKANHDPLVKAGQENLFWTECINIRETISSMDNQPVDNCMDYCDYQGKAGDDYGTTTAGEKNKGMEYWLDLKSCQSGKAGTMATTRATLPENPTANTRWKCYCREGKYVED